MSSSDRCGPKAIGVRLPPPTVAQLGYGLCVDSRYILGASSRSTSTMTAVSQCMARLRTRRTAPRPLAFKSWCVWEILDKYPALVRYYSEEGAGMGAGAGGAAAFLCHYYFLRT